MCQNGGTCKLVFNSTNAVQSRCSCQFGFYGAFCEKCNYIHYVVNGRIYGRLNIMRQEVNICLHFVYLYLAFLFDLQNAVVHFSPLSFVLYLLSHLPSQWAHCAFTLRSHCVHLRSSLHSIRAHRLQSAHCAFRMRLLCVHRSFTYRSFR